MVWEMEEEEEEAHLSASNDSVDEGNEETVNLILKNLLCRVQPYFA